MAVYGTMVITNLGLALYAKAQTGTPLNFTRLQLGSGAVPGGLNPVNFTALVTPISYFPINSITSSANVAYVKGIYENSALASSTYSCEIGLFAQDPTAGEILYAYANAGVNGDTIPAIAAGPLAKQFTVNAAVGGATSITASIPAGTWAPINSPDLTGNATAPNLTVGTNSNRIANAKFVADSIAAIPIDPPPAWANVTGKPVTFPPSLHGHQSSDITDSATKRFTTDTQQTYWNNKLDGTSFTGANVLSLIKAVDGAGSGLDADLFDGLTSTQFAKTLGYTTSATILNNNTNLESGIYSTAEGPLMGLPWTWAHIINMLHYNLNGYNAQIAVPLDSASQGSGNDMMVRYSTNGVWTAWKKIWTDNSLRLNGNSLEYYVNGAWIPVGANAVQPTFVRDASASNYSYRNQKQWYTLLDIQNKRGALYTFTIPQVFVCYNYSAAGKVYMRLTLDDQVETITFPNSNFLGNNGGADNYVYANIELRPLQNTGNVNIDPLYFMKNCKIEIMTEITYAPYAAQTGAPYQSYYYYNLKYGIQIGQ